MYPNRHRKTEILVQQAPPDKSLSPPYSHFARFQHHSQGQYPHFGESHVARAYKGSDSMDCRRRNGPRPISRRIQPFQRSQSYRSQFQHLLVAKRLYRYHSSQPPTPTGMAPNSYLVRPGSTRRPSRSNLVPRSNRPLLTDWFGSSRFKITTCS